eukprot:TRINITY_DN1378_c0_g1_i4.p1 TRINITY_DN1378_c0_g1~~TRINITY_DN1378_c0_g1_i4.p1  ORF type:complete len:132 (+),score=24.38 TRINITY_DN1378_c0_g1_i4:82-477(+)
MSTLKDFLDRAGTSHLLPLFEEQGVDIETLLDLTKDDLNDLELADADSNKILSEIQKSKERPSLRRRATEAIGPGGNAFRASSGVFLHYLFLLLPSLILINFRKNSLPKGPQILKLESESWRKKRLHSSRN